MPASANSASDSVRQTPRVLWAVALAALALRIGLGIYESRHPPRSDSLVRWIPAANASNEARTSGKPILYVFSASWCGPCKQMAHEVFSDKRLANRINEEFVPVHVLEGGEPGLTTADEAGTLLRQYGVGGYPTVAVVADDAPGSLLRGYPGKHEVETFLFSGWKTRRVPGTLSEFRAEFEKAKQAAADGGM